MFRQCIAVLAMSTLFISASIPALAQEAGTALRLTGDLGVGAYHTSTLVRGTADARVLPYAYLDYGRAFVRVDTFGFKLLPVGYGHLELVGRVSQEGYRQGETGLNGTGGRSDPLPFGVGTFQETALGAFFLYGFHDFSSGGALLDATYAAQFTLGRLTVYPLAGVEYRSAAYVRHLYGVSASQGASAGVAAYRPGTSLAPNAGLGLELPLGGDWYLSGQWRRKWFDHAVTDSPLVASKSQDSAFLAVSYRFR